MSTHNMYFVEKYKKYQYFLEEKQNPNLELWYRIKINTLTRNIKRDGRMNRSDESYIFPCIFPIQVYKQPWDSKDTSINEQFVPSRVAPIKGGNYFHTRIKSLDSVFIPHNRHVYVKTKTGHTSTNSDWDLYFAPIDFTVRFYKWTGDTLNQMALK